MRRSLFWIGCLAWMVWSCVPTRRVNLFQDEYAELDLAPTDTVLSTYTNEAPPIILQAGDMISVKVGSLTPEAYDFVKEYQARLGVFGQQLERSRATSGGLGAGGQNLGGASPIDNPLFQQLYGFQLKSNGTVELPYIGEVPVAGLDTETAASVIRDSLENQFKKPIVRVEYLNFNFTVLGEVGTPGRFTSYSTELSVMDALLLAGNFTEFSDRAKVKVIRDRGGEKKVFYVNLLEEQALGKANYYLQPGDIIVVGQLKVKATRQYTISNVQFVTGLASTGITIWLLIDRIINNN